MPSFRVRAKSWLAKCDGSFNVERSGLSFWQYFSPYHFMLTIPWWQFFTFTTALTWWRTACSRQLISHVGPVRWERHTPAWNAIHSCGVSFSACRRFRPSVTASVIRMPLVANALVALESLSGLIGFGIITGLLFARFSGPNAKILFSRHAIVAPYQGITAFEFRVANGLRHNELMRRAPRCCSTNCSR